jgi:Na+-driven multidrug efflux pump
MVAQCLGLSITTFISQNVGAKSYERAFKGIRTVMAMGFVAVAFFGIPIYFFADTFMRLFTSDAEAIKYGVGMITVMMPLYYIQTLHQIFSNAVRGFGKSLVVMLTSVFGLIVCRQIFLAISMSINRTIENVFWAYPVGWACAALFAFCYYYFTIRRPFMKNENKTA